MRKLILLTTVILTTVFTGCSFDDSDIWNELNGQEERLTQLEQKVSSLNSDIVSIQTIVQALQSNDMITSVTQITDGYVINFLSKASITIKNGAAGATGATGAAGADGVTPVIAVAEEDGNYYWTVNGVFLTDGAGEKIAVAGKDGVNGSDGAPGAAGQDAIAPQVRIDATTFEWEISTDGGSTWTSTGIVAKGQDGAQGAVGTDGDSLFASVDTTTSTDYVIFTLTDGTIFNVPVYGVLSLTFEGLRLDVFEIVANDPAVELEYSNTGTIAKIGIASALPAGWNIKVDANNKIYVSSTVTGEIDVLIVATSSDGSSASYWVAMSALGSAPVSVNSIATLETAIAGASDGDIIELESGNYETSNPVLINKNITLRAADTENTVFSTDGTHPAIQISNTAATIDGIKIVSDDVTTGALALISLTGNTTGTVIQNCILEGSYDLASGNDSQVVRGILAYASYPLSIIGNTFINLRQPAYIECAAIIENNHTEGTRGWVICLNHNVSMTGNTFGDNAVDIAIIENNGAADLGYYDDARVLKLHQDNDNAHIDNQINVGGTRSYISIYKSGVTY